MSQADRIRQFAIDRHIAPARVAHLERIAIRAGDVHREMGLHSALPAVCSAIGSHKFEDLSGTKLLGHRGPANGANVYFDFRIEASSSAEPQPERRAAVADSAPTVERRGLGGALVLVSCVKSKLPHAAQARELYTSAWFRKAREIVEASGSDWLILSARHGLVRPDEVIAPYEFTLNSVVVANRRAWAANVLANLLPQAARYPRVVILAGERYREFIVDPLREHGLLVEVPMRGLGRGKQLAWLSKAK